MDSSKYLKKPCCCGCGEDVTMLATSEATEWYKKGHRENPVAPPAPTGGFDELVETLSAPPEVSRETPPDGPPPYPAQLDRRRWRIASERPNILVTSPWIKTQCRNCVLPMWTRDPLSMWEKGGVCEECDYILRSELHEQRHQRMRSRRMLDLFRPV